MSSSETAQPPSAYQQILDLSANELVTLAGYLSRSAPEIVLEALEVLRDLKAQGRA